ncbi:hypothetical protein K523DRAFT_418796 [Schizophyllum commune Tattone D]|nr:hypothetical protein K523DRAFT_418796 [Schizophyllum commune Tattone D]
MSSPAYYMPSVPSQRAHRRGPGYPRVTSSTTRPNMTSATRSNMVQAKLPNMTSLTRPDTKSTTSLPTLTYQPSYISTLYKPSKGNALYRAPSGQLYRAPSGHLYRANKAYAPSNKANKEYAPPRMTQMHGDSPYLNANGLPLATGAPYAANLPLAPALVNILTDSDVKPITDNASKPTSYIVTRRPQYPRSEGYYSDDDEEPSSEEDGSPASSSSGEFFSSPASSSEEFFSASEDEGACSSTLSDKALTASSRVSSASNRVSPASNYVPLNDAALIASPDDHLIAFGDDYLSLTEDDASMPTKDDDDRSSPEDERSDSEDERSDSEDGRTASEELTDSEEDERHRRELKHLAMAVEHVRQSRLDARFEEAAKRGSRVVPAMCAGRAPSAKNLPKGEVRTAMVAFIAARGEGRAVSRGPGGEAERFEKVDARNDEKFSYSKFAQLHAQRARLDHLQRANAKPHSPVYEQHKASHAEYVQRRALFAQLAHLEGRNLPGAPVRNHPAHPDAAYISPRDLALQGPPPVSRAQIEWEVREGGPGAEAYRTAMWVQYQQARARDGMAVGA